MQESTENEQVTNVPSPNQATRTLTLLAQESQQQSLAIRDRATLDFFHQHQLFYQKRQGPQYFPKPQYLPPAQRNYKTCHRRVHCPRKPTKRNQQRRQHCFNGTAPVRLFDGTTQDISKLKPGDILLSANLSPTVVSKIKVTHYFRMMPMVVLEDFQITRGHPIFLNRDWFRPDEIFPLSEVWVSTLYNIYAEPFHEIIVGSQKKYICTSLGGKCPRITQKDPYADILFGSGYGSMEAKKYKWLLTLTDRIPDESVEEETKKYWERQRNLQNEEQVVEVGP
jgi:hypothetical protein